MPLQAEQEQQYWLWLHHAGPALHQHIIELLPHLPSLGSLLEWSESALYAAGFTKTQTHTLLKPDYTVIQPTLDWLAESAQHHVIPYHDPRYPALLKQISDPPFVLYLKGSPHILSAPQLGVVGARKATPAGCGLAFDWSKSLSEVGLTITSGMALGIDAQAHRGAIAAKCPTIAVVGTSPDIDYPRQHTRLAQEILAQGGAVVSEYWPTTPALVHHFPRRNRLISGLSRGVFVVEAALRSGSLITARMALEQNREVFALPGSIHNPFAQGTNHLIKQGAKLVDCTSDILEEYTDFFQKQKISSETGQDSILCAHLGKEEVKILQAIAEYPTGVEAIVNETGFCAQTVSSRLMELMFQGLIKAMPGGYVRVRGAQNERECA
jgi:DNA processing protein